MEPGSEATPLFSGLAPAMPHGLWWGILTGLLIAG